MSEETTSRIAIVALQENSCDIFPQIINLLQEKQKTPAYKTDAIYKSLDISDDNSEYMRNLWRTHDQIDRELEPLINEVNNQINLSLALQGIQNYVDQKDYLNIKITRPEWQPHEITFFSPENCKSSHHSKDNLERRGLGLIELNCQSAGCTSEKHNIGLHKKK